MLTTDTDTKPVALITGAAGSLGRAIAEAFHRNGYRLALLDRRLETLRETAATIDGQSLLLEADLGEATEVLAATQATLERWRRIDVLCNVAGGFRMGTRVHETSDADWLAILQMNAGSVLRTARAVVPTMIAQRHGRIVNIGADSAQRGKALMGPYCMSKAAVHSLTQSMAAELGPEGIHVNCILPSVLDTPQNRLDMPASMHASFVPLARVAGLAAYLASPDADALNGVLIEATASS